MYVSPSKHVPRSNPGRASGPPSRALGSGATKLPGVTVYGRGSGVSSVRTPPALPSNYRVAPRVSPQSVPSRVREAVEKAFPYGNATPRYDSGWSQAAGRTAAYAAVAEAIWDVSQAVREGMDVTKWALDNGLFPDPNAGEAVNPGLTFVGARAHTGHVSPGNYTRQPGWGQSIQLGNPLPVPQNSWLLQTTLKNQGFPNGFWGNNPTFAEVPAGWYWIRTIEDYTFGQNATSDLYRRSVEVYRNNQPNPLPQYVPRPAWQIPLGVPLPEAMPDGYPLNRPNVVPRVRPLTRPRPIPEVAVEVKPGARPAVRVYPARPRRPGKKAKETKYYGRAQGAASAVYWLYENSSDWADWLNILLNAAPGTPTEIANAGPNAQLRYLYENPGALKGVDMGEVLAGLGGWLVDEIFGAFVGEINKRANRGISSSQKTTVDMRTNVSQHYAPGGPSPGSFASDFLNTFL